ncbi:tRNA pseudouridine(55) synthase TruB [Paenibacillus segetis]|uniref:tRNA pseudouridine synthase B n=1 Tax=Paenibacillus segetis TaxID=1325360 RepID=A0ABQ1Y9V9_9BACL|nr:tRNA pseudouridine(55) synthase TruB [Paenibacillus segetis]GGH17908.1 tRNA pseudouridine synthase B [Paenibacillus segetis]
MSSYEGILPVNKPAGFTSHDVVAKTRRILSMKRIGHTGTLDPAVTGVLPLCLGRATRMVEYLQELPKEYEATLLLGVATDTEDISGNVIEQMEQVSVTEEEVQLVLSQFTGTISQVPPMYSALKQDGKRLYELAREGKTVERKPREVTIHEIEMISFNPEGPHPTISFRALCSKGTYIRTLCVDIGQALGVPATMSKLKRTMSAGIPEAACLTLEDIAKYAEEGTLASYLLPVDKAVEHLPAHTVVAEKVPAALQGQKLSSNTIHPGANPGDIMRLYGPNEQFLGIFRLEEHGQFVRPVKVFLPE